jgi:hypothetical protein
VRRAAYPASASPDETRASIVSTNVVSLYPPAPALSQCPEFCMNALSARARVRVCVRACARGGGGGGQVLSPESRDDGHDDGVTTTAWRRTSSRATAQSSMSCSARYKLATGVNRIQGHGCCPTDRQRPPHHCMALTESLHMFRMWRDGEHKQHPSNRRIQRSESMGFPPVLLQSSNRDIGGKRRWCAQSSIGAEGGGCCMQCTTHSE